MTITSSGLLQIVSISLHPISAVLVISALLFSSVRARITAVM